MYILNIHLHLLQSLIKLITITAKSICVHRINIPFYSTHVSCFEEGVEKIMCQLFVIFDVNSQTYYSTELFSVAKTKKNEIKKKKKNSKTNN